MTLRITERTSALPSPAGLQSNAARLSALQRQLSSGRNITKPSDDPVGTVTALALRGELKRATQYHAGAQSGLGWLSQVDTTLSSLQTQARHVRMLVLRGADTGASDADARSAIADNVDRLRASMLALANTTYEGRPIFGGTTAGSLAFDGTGAYVGDQGAISRTVGPDNDVQINQTGTQIFGANGSNLFDLLSTISADLRTDPSALSGDLGGLDTAVASLRTQQGHAGAIDQRIQNAQTIASDDTLRLSTQLSGIQDVDVADLAIEVSSANLAYQESLQTTADIRQTYLLDYLR